MNKISIALVDDHQLFRKGIASLIETFPDYEVIFDVGSGDELFERLSSKQQPRIILLDMNMPVMNGLQVASRIQKEYPGIAVIILSMVEDADTVLSVIKKGIKGYLLKDSDPSAFRNALDAVATDEVYFPSFVMRYMSDRYCSNAAIKLSERELEFLKLASSELTYKEIADQMFLSQRTIDGYRDSLFLKLQVKNRVGLVLYAIKHKIVEI